jgi:hypothetical protein
MPKTVKTPDAVVSGSRLDGAEIFRQVMADVPFVRITSITREAVRLDLQFDYDIRVSVGDRDYIIFLDEKAQGEPRWLRPGIEQLSHRRCEYVRRSGIRSEDAAAVLVAPYVSPDMARECRDAGIGYIDNAGNCYLTFGTVYIRRDGKPNPIRRDPSLRTLFSPKAERVLRVLLTYPNRSWRTVQLANEATVSTGQIAKIKKALIAQDMIDEVDGIVLTKPSALLDLWAKDYARRPDEKIGMTTQYYVMDSLQELENKLAKALHEIPDFPVDSLALSGLSAANRLAPYTRSPRLSICIHNVAVRVFLESLLSLTQVESGANVLLSIPYDEGVFYGTEMVQGLPVPSPIQVYLDAYRLGGRAREGAEHLRNEVLTRLWNQTDS